MPFRETGEFEIVKWIQDMNIPKTHLTRYLEAQ
jgi:hypothetical protein